MLLETIRNDVTEAGIETDKEFSVGRSDGIKVEIAASEK